jgi:hypothetical protein
MLNLNRLWNFNNKVYYEEVDNTIKLNLNETISVEILNSIISHINDVLGYFPSHIVTHRKNLKYSYDEVINELNNNTLTGLYFDAKYDQEIPQNHLPKLLYHITPSIYDKKISRIGLCPKHKNKMSAHRDRIYLTDNIQSAEGLLTNPEFKIDSRGNEIKNFTVYEIDVDKLKTKWKVIFLKDPQYVKNGMYTHENISPEFLNVVKRINLDN